MSFTHLAKSSDLKTIIEELDKTGALIIDNFIPTNALNASLKDYFDAARTSHGEFWGTRTKRFGALPVKSELCSKLLIDEKVLSIANNVLNAHDDTDIQVNLTQAIEILPGERAQIIHRDDQLFPIASNRELMLNFLFAVDDFTEDNGATRIVPGSHKWDRTKFPNAGESVQACMKAGSCLIYRGSVLHGGGHNKSSTSRRAVVLSYNLGFLRQSENLMLSMPWEQVKTFPLKLQKLLGYKVCKPNVGWVEGMEPLEWIDAGKPQLSAAQDSLTLEQTALIASLRDGPEHQRYFG